jgi:Tfp pilus assembly protein PilV
MKKKRGLTTIETLIGVTLLAAIVGGILGIFVLLKEYFDDGTALSRSQATARLLTEKMMRPVRYGKTFNVSVDGNTLTLVGYGGVVDTFQYNVDNTISKNGNTIGTNIYKIAGVNLFQQIEVNKLLKVNFEVKNLGVFSSYRTVRIDTDIRLRNEANLSR